MLSYRHAHHAGNHADVLKHLVLVQVLDHFNRKAAPYWVIDTHAGPGCYALDSGLAARHGEADSGIGRLRGADAMPAALARYAQVVDLAGQGARIYPGSPEIAWRLTRETDRLRLFELHPTESRALAAHFADAGRRVQVTAADGFAALKALLPPPTRRAVVLIDPPYEIKQDYETLVATLRMALKRFATGCYLVWYPILARPGARALPSRLTEVAASAASWLHVRLHVGGAAADGLGMSGSGMFVFNPPWTLYASLQETMPWLVQRLAQDEEEPPRSLPPEGAARRVGGTARFELEMHQP